VLVYVVPWLRACATTNYYVAGGTHELVESDTTDTHKSYVGGAAVVIEVTSSPTSMQTIHLSTIRPIVSEIG
jgi:hypothetical protein